MTVGQAIKIVDMLKPGNSFSEKEKIRWLSDLDGLIKKETIDNHEGSENIKFNGYNDSDTDTVLIAKEPYSDIYTHWLIAMIDLYSGELTRYDNDVSLFNEAKRRYVDYYNRTHAPKGVHKLRW